MPNQRTSQASSFLLKHWVAMESRSNTHSLHAQSTYITSQAATPKGLRKRCMAQPGLPLIKKTFAQRYFQFTNSHHHYMHKRVEEVNENTQTAVNSHSSLPPTSPPPPTPIPSGPNLSNWNHQQVRQVLGN